MWTVKKVATLQATLGEGARWSPDETALWSVDILGRKLFCTDTFSGTTRHWDMPTELGAALPRRSGGLILCLRSGFAFFDPASGALQPILHPEPDLPLNRMNDAAIDHGGRLWAGTMDFDAVQPSGALYRLDAALTCQRMDSGYIVSNGPAFSPDGRTMYHNETMRGQVFAFDFDVANGAIANKRLFIQLPPFAGLTDGLTVDAEGDVWLCQITAGRVGRYAPDGRLKQSIAVPVPMCTSCCFGGPDLSTLYITTARIILSPPELAAYPDSGDLFAVPTDTRGQPPRAFAG